MRAFRFGLLLGGEHTTRAELSDLCRRAEAEGYDIVLGTDHLCRQDHLSLLQAAAEDCKLRIGTLVLNNDFRHPVLLAQELATLDMLTDGRLEIGLGAGWAIDEYDGASIAFDKPGRRLARLKESVEIIRQALTDGQINRPADGPYGRVLIGDMPCSKQRPFPTLLIGGGGPRTLAYAASVADVVSLDPRAFPGGGHDATDVTEALFNDKVGWIREAAGGRFAELELNVIIFDVDASYRTGNSHSSIAADPLSIEDIAGSPHYLLGDSVAMAERLIERRDRWSINYLAIKPHHLDVLAPVVARLAGT